MKPARSAFTRFLAQLHEPLEITGSGHPVATHAGSSPHDTHAGHQTPVCFGIKFWISLLLTIPTLVWGDMLPRRARLHAAARSRLALDPAGLRHGGLPLRRLVFLQGACASCAIAARA